MGLGAIGDDCARGLEKTAKSSLIKNKGTGISSYGSRNGKPLWRTQAD